jgi:glycosyltransferase involved in cell wall biosynthesis
MLWRLPVPLVYGPIGGGQTAPSNYWRCFGRGWPVEMARKATGGPMLRLNRRSRETLRNAAVTLVTNSATAAACRRLGVADVRYMLAEGVPADWLSSVRGRPPGIPVVLWVGGLLPHKAPGLALEAFAQLRRTTAARLVVVGDGPLLHQLRAMVDERGLTGAVEFLGRIPWRDLKPVYDSASVLLFTSLRDSSGSQFLEALSRGVPAVALDHHGIADLDVGLAALKVGLTENPADLPGRLAAALETILCDDEWDRRSEACVTWAAGHVWPAKAAAATQIYHQILSAALTTGAHTN